MHSTRLVRLARPRAHPAALAAAGQGRFFISNSALTHPAKTRNPSPLTTQPASDPRHSDAYPNAPPSPASHSSKTPRYVAATPDPPNTAYDIPSGPYRTAAPYAHTHVEVSASPTCDAPSTSKGTDDTIEPSSTSASPAHPNTTQRVPRVPLTAHASQAESFRTSTEYAESPSSAVRNRSSPGVMKAASEGGLGIMSSEGGVEYPEVGLEERNPPPLAREAEEISRAGVEGAWKLRK